MCTILCQLEMAQGPLSLQPGDCFLGWAPLSITPAHLLVDAMNDRKVAIYVTYKHIWAAIVTAPHFPLSL